MPSTSTLAVDPFDEDMLLATQVIKGPVSMRERIWFANVMPALRANLEGVLIKTLRERLHAQEANFFDFIWRLYKAGVVWAGKPGSYRLSGIVRLTPNFWLKETARLQAAPCSYVMC